MKLIYGEIPQLDKFFEKDSIWQKADLKDYKRIINNRIKYLFFISLMFSFGVGYSLYPYKMQIGSALKYFAMYLILAIILIYPIHYLIHIILLPKSIQKGYFIINWKNISSRLFINRSITKNRYILAYGTPFVLLTVLPIIYVTFIDHNLVLYAIAYGNMLYSVYDILVCYSLIRYIPDKTIIRFYGQDMYYKYQGFTTSLKTESKENKDFDSNEKVIVVKKPSIKL